MLLTRRAFARLCAAMGVSGFWPWRVRRAYGETSLLLDAATHPKFVNPLPNLLDPRLIFAARSGGRYEIGMDQVRQNVGLVGPRGRPLITTVWGYGGAAKQPGLPAFTYPGRTLVARKGRPVTVQWSTSLPPGGHLLPLDTTLHWARPAGWPNVGVPVVPHLHGGHTESDSDGLPEHWWTARDGSTGPRGPRFVKSLYRYDNDQDGATLWYHDHALGITRLNMYAGLVGLYILRDENELSLGLPGSPYEEDGAPRNFQYEVPLVIQDRLFTEDGQLYCPTVPHELEPGFPAPPAISVLPEFFGDFVLVNGVAWPVLDVEPRTYRFRILNASDSRFYNLWITGGNRDPLVPDTHGISIIQIGTDQGLLHAPIRLQEITVGPGERADVVVDFASFAGHSLIMRNNARAPFPAGDPVNPRAEGLVMAFRVGTKVSVADRPVPTTLLPEPLTPIQLLRNVTRHRKLLLFEGTDRFGRLQPLLGVAEATADVSGRVVNGTLLWNDRHDPVTENPMEGDVEVWEIFNATADAHPIHLHPVKFLILDRQPFTGTIEAKENIAHDGSTTLGGILKSITLRGEPQPPPVYARGWKDTAPVFPNEVTRLIAKFDLSGRYVWHCHIPSHEDHQMMRPYYVGPMTKAMVGGR